LKDVVTNISVNDSINNRRFEIAGFHVNARTSRIPSVFRRQEHGTLNTYFRYFDETGNTTRSILEAWVLASITLTSDSEVNISVNRQRSEVRDVIFDGVRLGIERGWFAREQDGSMWISYIGYVEFFQEIIVLEPQSTSITRNGDAVTAQRDRLLGIAGNTESAEFVELRNYNFLYDVEAIKYIPTSSQSTTHEMVMFSIDNRERLVIVMSAIRNDSYYDLATLIRFVQRIRFID